MFQDFRQLYVNLITSGGHLLLLFIGFQIEEKEAWPWILALISAISFFAWMSNQRRSRLILNTPTSKIASAAQGYVELSGQAKQAHDTPLLSKLSTLPCVWYRYMIEEKSTDGKNYNTIERGTSDDLILIDDGSGQCFIDPDGAEIITCHKKVWTNSGYRYTEYLLNPFDSLYVIGEFTTLGGANSTLDTKADLSELLTEWKHDKAPLLERFDLNKDGEIDAQEWELAVLAAKREVARQHIEIHLKDGVHTLRKPGDGQLFLISNLPEVNLARKYVLWGWFHLLTFLGAGSAAVFVTGI